MQILSETIEHCRKTQDERYIAQEVRFNTLDYHQKKNNKLLLDISINVSELQTWSQNRRSVTEAGKIISLESFCKTHNIVVPFEAITQFEEFESRLAQEKSEVLSDLVGCKNIK